MPKYREERKLSPKPGAGLNAGFGLKGKKQTLGQQECLEEMLPRHEMGRRQLLQRVSKVRSSNQCASAKAKDQEGDEKSKEQKRQEIDVDEFIKRITPSVVGEFNRLCGQKPVSGTLTDVEIDLSMKMMDADPHFFYEYTLLRSIGVYTWQQMFKAGIHAALCHLQAKEWRKSFRLLRDFVRFYLSDEKARAPHELGKKAMDYLEIISRAWVNGHAAEYVDSELMRNYRMFHQGFTKTITTWSADGISAMQMFGKIEDLPATTVIGSFCYESSTEGTCKMTAEFIRIMECLRLSLNSLDADEKSKFGIDRGLSDEQLLYRISILFQRLGIGNLLRKHPSFEQFGNGHLNPYAKSTQAEKLFALKDEGLAKGFDFNRDNFQYDDHRNSGFVTACRYFQAKGIVERKLKLLKGNNETGTSYQDREIFVLTEKGKRLVARLMSQVPDMKIDYQ
jgi:hypothetical protein